jgi:hypothetical protein
VSDEQTEKPPAGRKKAKQEPEVAAEWVEVGKLVPWDQNPRVNDHVVAKLAASIKEFGWAEVIVARKANGMVISGHTRLKAAHKLGLPKVPVRWLDIDDRAARQLALASNKLGELAVWDDDKLAAILAELQKEAVDLEIPFDLDALGFSQLEADALLRHPGAWAGDDAVNPDNIGDYDPASETFVVKVEKIKAADKERVLTAVNDALSALGLGYAAKAF